MKYLLNGEVTNRLIFHPVSLSDFDEWLLFFKDATSFQHWKGDFEDPATECRKWYERQMFRYANDLGGMNALIDKETGRLAGHCGLLVQTVDEVTELEIGYSLMPSFRGKGIATEAAKKCRDFAFGSSFATSLISIISTTNAASINVAIKNGMTPDKKTVYHDNEVNIYRITKSKWSGL